MLGWHFPAVNKTINFVIDTLRRKTMVTPATRDALGVGGATCEDWSDSFVECVELPAARIGRERGDHFLLVTDAIVANREQARTIFSLEKNLDLLQMEPFADCWSPADDCAFR